MCTYVDKTSWESFRSYKSRRVANLCCHFATYLSCYLSRILFTSIAGPPQRILGASVAAEGVAKEKEKHKNKGGPSLLIF